jgi:uncharacterized membrane protein YbhN (UPF0104 family)
MTRGQLAPSEQPAHTREDALGDLAAVADGLAARDPDTGDARQAPRSGRPCTGAAVIPVREGKQSRHGNLSVVSDRDAIYRRRGGSHSPLWGKPVGEDSALLSTMGVVQAAQRLVMGRASIITSRRVRVLAQVLLFCALAFVLLRLHSIWHESQIDLSQVNWPLVMAAGAVAAAAVVGAGYVWLQILRRLGVHVRRRWIAIFLDTQLGKYIPGSVWHYAGRTALTRVEGVAVGTVALSVAVELAASVVAGALVASLVLGVAGLIVTAALIASACLAASRLEIRRLQPLGRLAPRVAAGDIKRILQATVNATPLYVVIWVMVAVAFWLTARALFSVPVSQAPYYMGVYGVACLTGLVVIFAPVGFGIREALIVALLRSRLGTADALVLAASSRLLLTIVDLATAGAGAWLLRRNGKALVSAGRRAQEHEARP